MNTEDEFLIKLSNLWFYKEAPVTEISESLKRFMGDIVSHFEYGDDVIFAHENIQNIVMLFKDYGIVDYNKSIMEIYFENRMRAQIKLGNMLKNPEVNRELMALKNVLGEMLEKIVKDVKKKLEKEENASAIPTLTHAKIYKN